MFWQFGRPMKVCIDCWKQASQALRRDLKVGIVKQLDQYQPWTNLSSQILPSPFTVVSNVFFCRIRGESWAFKSLDCDAGFSGSGWERPTARLVGNWCHFWWFRGFWTLWPATLLRHSARFSDHFSIWQRCAIFSMKSAVHFLVLSCCCWGKGLWSSPRCMVFACGWTTTSFEITSCSCQHHGWVCGSTRETCDLASSIKDKFVVSHWSQLY